MTLSQVLPDLKGVLRPQIGLMKFRTIRRSPAPELSPFVEYYWLTSWDLRGQSPFEQPVVPYPCVHAVFASDYTLVHGVMLGHFSKRISGRAHVLGVRFRAGGFRPFLGAPVSTITDRSVPMARVFGLAADEAATAVLATEDDDEQVAIADSFLGRCPPARDPTAEAVSDLVDRIIDDTGIARVDMLSDAVGVSVRRLQRLFAEYVGVGPKWVIQRRRIHDAAARAAGGADVDWAGVAAELGYSDQAHFTRDFTSTVGVPPAQYARSCDDPAVPTRPAAR